ncbi:MAG: hypothetical protein IJ723_07150, partial [Ruminococcus sp.]|nr:hypothetical protein [Ruminococcus sp.]
LLKVCDMLDTAEDSIVEIYKSKLTEGKNEKALRKALAAETWFTGKSVGELFDFAVEDTEPAAAALSSFYGSYKNRPADKKDEKKTDNTAVIDVFRKILTQRSK